MKPSLAPQQVSEAVWYYEDRRGLEFIVECRNPLGVYHQTIRFRVPRAMLRRSLARIRKPGGGKP